MTERQIMKLLDTLERIAGALEHLAGNVVTHRMPTESTYVTPCCGITPSQLPRFDRLTNDPAFVTCKGPA